MKPKSNRVLGRTGARELTPEELTQINGSQLLGGGSHTNVITVNPTTGSMDTIALG